MSLPTIAGYPLPDETELPGNRVDWRPDPTRAVLLIHDMQRYFTAPFDDVEPLAPAVANIVELRRICTDLAIPVIFTRQPGGQTRDERGLLLDMWGWGPPADPTAVAFHAELMPGDGDTVLEKRRYSAFVDSPFADLLGDRDQLVITGIYAHIGVTATACDAFMRGVQAFVVADAVADFTRADHLASLRYVARRCGVVMSAKHVGTALGGAHRDPSAEGSA
ncbi:isochorismatase family protein [Micromonospora craniellae]|uniref:Isochorismatase family protein n=1 Tax=Micromonospora craniellae TaxID=2294034 RepID=A0A372G6R8_9ACTN|nr:isochorismatase family protein [Micromonospora craniellae]QOC90147.1 isochorismatase family protein [Micromonospora craniellae]RFS48466.1 isochorismatase family protein [Micromonospora craniellae]